MALTEFEWRIINEADEAGIKLEQIEGLPVWEFFPTVAHQEILQKALASIRKPEPGKGDCGCIPILDLTILFPDGSFRRPDLAVFCTPPEPRDKAATTIPAAVLEVISPDSRKKDLELSPPFFLKHGVLDVLVVDPGPGEVIWFTKTGKKVLKTGQRIELKCGCTIEV